MKHYLVLLRPSQWIKNGFVLIGFLFARRWGDAALALDTALVFAGFCLISSAVYAMNDVLDRERDRTHPTKRERPIAAGHIGPRTGLAVAVLLALAGLATGAAVSPIAAWIFALYLILNGAYSAGAKHVPILDVFMIAAGFMLRLLAGTAGIGIVPSHWLIICGFMVTLCLGFAKRRAELMAVHVTSGDHRPALEGYTRELLDTMIAVTAAGVLVTYGLYTVNDETLAVHRTRDLIWTLPFVAFGLFRFLHRVHFGNGGRDPAQDLMRDPWLAVAVVGWIIVTVAILTFAPPPVSIRAQ